MEIEKVLAELGRLHLEVMVLTAKIAELEKKKSHDAIPPNLPD